MNLPLRLHILLLSILTFHISFTNGQSFPSATQEKTIQRLTNWVSSFLSHDQYQVFCDKLCNELYNNGTWDEIKSTAMDTLMDQLTTTQYAMVAAKGSIILAKMGPKGITDSLSKLMSVLGSNLEAVFNQLHDFVNYMKKRGMQQKGISKNVYRIVNSFASQKRIKTIFTRVSLKFETSDWATIKTALDGIFQFQKNGV